MRFDVVLHQLRLYKSRSQASAAIAAGEALLDGATVKASHTVRAGHRITISGAGARRVFEILELPGKSVSRETAKSMVRVISGPDAG